MPDSRDARLACHSGGTETVNTGGSRDDDIIVGRNDRTLFGGGGAFRARSTPINDGTEARNSIAFACKRS